MGMKSLGFCKIFSLLLIICFAAVSNATCPEWLSQLGVKTHEGQFKSHDSTAGETRHFLGGGLTGGLVHRVKGRGYRYVEKQYATPELIYNDIKAYSFLDQALKNPSPGLHMRVVKVLEELPEMRLKLEDVEGETIADILERTRSRPLKKRLIAYFNEQISLLAQTIEKHADTETPAGGKAGFLRELQWGQNDTGRKTFLATFFTSPNRILKDYNIWIKADNILLTASGELVIIDPY
jgi:hypothetical protein